MKNADLFREIGSIDTDLITDNAPSSVLSGKRLIIKLVSAAACLLLALGICAAVIQSNNAISLVNSSDGVKVSYIGSIPQTGIVSDSLAYSFTESELLAIPTDIFRAGVKEIRNIKIDLNGRSLYRALAKVEIISSLRGSAEPGDVITVMLPCPIDEKTWVEDADTAAMMKEGCEGIFMTTEYTSDSVYTENGATLYLTDIADCGFYDGVRFAFLDTGNGLVFERSSYPSLSDAESLDEIEAGLSRLLN